ncbi:hypothetical protein HaLaN_07033 [Haematococcus lacustris]|uniref:Uncharacterized protein n=1 Tax=Haematococcus lacustris TaxID=44745 RepID=A0A699YN36_HAELA|nr:hypothetical protein HaLaN_07033 [Haematococcus lacustris]
MILHTPHLWGLGFQALTGPPSSPGWPLPLTQATPVFRRLTRASFQSAANSAAVMAASRGMGRENNSREAVQGACTQVLMLTGDATADGDLHGLVSQGGQEDAGRDMTPLRRDGDGAGRGLGAGLQQQSPSGVQPGLRSAAPWRPDAGPQCLPHAARPDPGQRAATSLPVAALTGGLPARPLPGAGPGWPNHCATPEPINLPFPLWVLSAHLPSNRPGHLPPPARHLTRCHPCPPGTLEQQQQQGQQWARRQHPWRQHVLHRGSAALAGHAGSAAAGRPLMGPGRRLQGCCGFGMAAAAC